MDKKTKACPFCGEEILETAVKCKHCGEFLDGRKEEPVYVEKEKKKKKTSIWTWLVLFLLIGLFVPKNDDPQTNEPKTNNINVVNHYENLQDAYNHHKNYIWDVCKEGLKLISTNQEHKFAGPTYAGEYMGKFIVKGTDHDVLFRCEFVPYENERGMNLNDVKREY